MALKRVETVDHLGTVRIEPLVEFPKRFDAQPIQPTLGVTADLNESGVAQHLEMPRHTRLAHTNGIDEFRDRSLATPHHVEDPSASWLGDHLKDGEVARHPI